MAIDTSSGPGWSLPTIRALMQQFECPVRTQTAPPPSGSCVITEDSEHSLRVRRHALIAHDALITGNNSVDIRSNTTKIRCFVTPDII